jgi:hypothetical protein
MNSLYTAKTSQRKGIHSPSLDKSALFSHADLTTRDARTSRDVSVLSTDRTLQASAS